MTATVFAEEMGVSYPTVVRWLKRKTVPGAVLRESQMVGDPRRRFANGAAEDGAGARDEIDRR
jgi:hypothetical protein